MEQPTKKRRVYRKRADSDDERREDRQHEAQLHRAVSDDHSADADKDQSMASVLRRRKLQQRNRVGIAFSNDTTSARPLQDDADMPEQDEQAASLVDQGASGARRFTHGTGRRVDDGTDRHIMAYIDSKLAQLRRDEDATPNQGPTLPIPPSQSATRERKPTSSGKLQEVDLGPGETELNIQRTEQARQRLEGGGELGEAQASKPQRVRTGRDGKPMKPRRRFRRRSEDIERDKLIDSLMKEARLDVYDRPDEVPNGTGDDEAADERIAEEFRRDFMNQLEDKNARRAPAPPPGPARGAKGETESKGPKLGGSRSARAAMRAKQEAEKKR